MLLTFRRRCSDDLAILPTGSSSQLIDPSILPMKPLVLPTDPLILPIDPFILPTLQVQAGQQSQKVAEADRQDEEGTSNLVDLQHSLVDYRAACMATEASIVGVSCQADEAQSKAVPLPAHLALWEVKIGDTLYLVMTLQVCVKQ